jgi:hypothetical protein
VKKLTETSGRQQVIAMCSKKDLKRTLYIHTCPVKTVWTTFNKLPVANKAQLYVSC